MCVETAYYPARLMDDSAYGSAEMLVLVIVGEVLA